MTELYAQDIHKLLYNHRYPGYKLWWNSLYSYEKQVIEKEIDDFISEKIKKIKDYRSETYAEGYSDGNKDGYDSGWRAGRQSGINKGYIAAIEKAIEITQSHGNSQIILTKLRDELNER